MNTKLDLTIGSIADLGRCMPSREAGFLVPCSETAEIGESAEVALRLDGPLSRTIALSGTIAAIEGEGEEKMARVLPNRSSWKRLFISVCAIPWRRSDDFVEEQSRRFHVDEAAFCYVPETGERYLGSLLDLSSKGAFIGLGTASIPNGAEFQFRGYHGRTWHTGRVRWSGDKHDQKGVGVSLAFTAPDDHQSWTTFMSGAAERAER